MSRGNVKKGGKQGVVTTEEILELHQGQDLFRSNLFRLQLTELLSEVKVAQSKTTTTQNELRELKEALENTPDREIGEADLKDLRVPLHGSPSDPRLHFSFRAPRNLQVIGSFLLNTVCRPDTNVDLAVEIPKKCLTTSDATNSRYEDKRAIYLYLLAQHLQSLDLYRDRIYFEAFRGDCHKPLLCIKQSSQRKKKTRFVIRIHTVIPEKLFRPGRLLPSWHNLQGGDEEEQNTSDVGRPSPFRNNAIVEDLMMVSHLAQLHTTITDCPAMIDAIIMFKVWLRQRDSLRDHSFNGFLMSMLMIYLLQARQLNLQMSSYQLFRVTLSFLAAGTLLEHGISLATDAADSLVLFREHFDVVFVDASGRLNLTARVSRSSMQELQYEAQLAMGFLKADATTGFQALFLSPVPFPLKFDQFFTVQPPKSLLSRPTSHPLDDRNWDDRLIMQMHTLFDKALHNRMPLISLRFPPLPTWELGQSVPAHNFIWIGIRLDPETAFDTLERGPPADDEEASQSFKELWKEKCDLWQMNDGSLVQAVEWEVESEQEHRLPSLQLAYLLEKHFHVEGKALCAFVSQLDPILYSMHPKTKSLPTPLKASLYLLSVYETLEEMIYGLSELPLRIADIHRGHSALSFTALHTPVPHALLVPRERYSKQQQQYLRYVEPVPVILELEESSQWPNDIQAIQALKASFYVLLSRELKKHHALECLVTKQFIDVFVEGLVFRIHIYVPQERDATEQFISIQHAKALVRENVHKPAHWAAMRGLQANYSVFGTTVRLAKFWVHSQLMSDSLNEPTIELLVASLFTCPAPFSPPRSHLMAFFRFLHLLSTFPWAVSPLVVDVNEELTVEQHTEIQNEFNRLRKMSGSEQHSAMFIATPRDLQSTHWTRQQPSPMILQRVIHLASQCMDRLCEKMIHPFSAQLNSWKDWQTLFCTPLSDFDVILRLTPEVIPHGTQHGFYDKVLEQWGMQRRTDVSPVHASELLHRVSKFRNFEEELGPSQLLVGVHPVHCLVEELTQHFGEVAMFFYGEAGVNIIGVVWKPAAFMPQTIKPHTLQYSLPLPEECQPSKTAFVLRNVFDMIADMQTMGSGVISDIHLVQGSHRVQQ